MDTFEFSQLQGKIAAQESEITNLRAEIAKLNEEIRRWGVSFDECYFERTILEAEIRPLRDLVRVLRVNPGVLTHDPDEIEPNSDTGC